MNAKRRKTADEKRGKIQSGFRYGEGEKNGEKAKNAPKRPRRGQICDLEDKKREKKAVKRTKKNLFDFSQTLLCLKPFEDVQ